MMKVQKKKIYICTKNIINTVHELRTIGNSKNIKQVKNNY